MQAKTGRLLLTAASVMTLLALMSLPAMATPVTYELDARNKDIKGTGPYATVTLNLSSESKFITVTVQAEPGYTLKAGNDLLGFNYTGIDALSLSKGSGLNLIQTKNSMSEFGKFDYYINPDDDKSLGNTLKFTIARSNGNPFTNGVNDLVDYSHKANKSTTNRFALHVQEATSTGSTGYVGGGTLKTPPTPTPEPGSLALLGAGLVSFGGLMRRYRR